MLLKKTLLASVVTLTLTACGNTQGDRALSGGAIGAGVGALGSTAVAGDPLTGAVIGGAVGAAAGAFTDEDDVDLGEPAWR
ncbi:MAG: hypothetical protein AB7L92_02660 [Alphaproteobacteria bacterium]